MNRLSPQTLDEITSVAERWIRRCNKKLAPGGPVSAHRLRVVLANSENVRTEANGTIAWTGPAGEFTAEPVRDSISD